jgi:hypothetical protein
VTERIKQVQRTFFALLVAAVILCGIGYPLGDDGATMDALREVEAFARSFDRSAIERALLAHASAQGALPLAQVTAASAATAGKVSVAANAPAITPRATVALETLDGVSALAQAGATLEIGLPSAESLATALGWRLAHQAEASSFELQGISLGDEACTSSDLEKERATEAARTTLADARRAEKSAEKRKTNAEDLAELRRKRKASWKVVLKANEQRDEARAEFAKAQAVAAEAERRYSGFAEQALRVKAAGGAGEDCRLALASVVDRPSGKARKLTLPTAIERRSVSVPHITGAEFPVLHASGLWDELKRGSADQAIAALRARFSWHYAHGELGGVKVGGMTVLQLAPLVLLPFYFGLLRKSRGVGATYNPFDRPPGESLPTVGLGFAIGNLLVLVALPLLGCALCAWSLLLIDQWPIVPVLCALGSIGLGSSSQMALGELLDLRDAITRSHSNPPPAPSPQAR